MTRTASRTPATPGRGTDRMPAGEEIEIMWGDGTDDNIGRGDGSEDLLMATLENLQSWTTDRNPVT